MQINRQFIVDCRKILQSLSLLSNSSAERQAAYAQAVKGMTTEAARLVADAINAASGARWPYGISARHLDFDISTVKPGRWLRTFDAVAAMIGTGRTVALIGERGTGKTQMGAEIVKACNMVGRSAGYRRLAEFFLDLKKTYRKESESDEATVIQCWRGCKLLVLDECHERAATPWEGTMLNHLVDCRYGDMSDTIMIANATAAEFTAAVGPSIASRMSAGGIIECNWGSYRKANDEPKGKGRPNDE